MWKLVVIATVIMASLHDAPAAGADLLKGKLSECSAGVKGDVVVVNAYQIKILGFHYDGRAPAPHFHAMKKKATAIHKELGKEDEWVTLAFPGPGDCARIGKEYKGEDIMLTLPEPITEFKSIGAYCYAKCVNFGHFNVPDGIKPPDADPATLNAANYKCAVIPEEPANAKTTSCTIATTHHSKFGSCKDGEAGDEADGEAGGGAGGEGGGEGGGDSAGQITSSFWVLVPVFALAVRSLMMK